MSNCIVDPITIISEIKNACNSLYTTIKEDFISEQYLNLTDEQLDALLISTNGTRFEKQSFNSLEEIYEINLILLLNETNTPFTTIITKQRQTLEAILNYKNLTDAAGNNSLIFQETNASNIVAINNHKSKALSCVIKLQCDVVTYY